MKKLTQSQYFELQDQFDRLPDLNSSYSNSGEHYVLMTMLNRLGYHPGSREEAVKLAERMLSNGYS